MPNCEICQSELHGGGCVFCTELQRQRFRDLDLTRFPGSAMPSEGWAQPLRLAALRRALLDGDLQGADRLWSQALASLRPIGSDGRRQWAEALDAVANLKDAMGDSVDAGRLRQRALSARKDPSQLKHKQRGGDARSSWGSHAALRDLSEDEDLEAKARRVEAVRLELEAQLLRQEKRQRVMRVGAFSLAGVATGGALGVPVAGGALGLGLGWVWGRFR